MKRTLLFSVFVLAACSTPDAPPSGRTTAATTPRGALTPLAIARNSLAFSELGTGAAFVAEGPSMRASITRTLTATAPRAASGMQRIVTAEARDFELDVTPLDVGNAAGTADGTTVTYANAALDTDLVLATTPTAFEEVRVLRSAEAPSTLRWRITGTPSVARVRVRDNRVEALDANGVVRIGSAPIFAADANGVQLPVSVALEDDVLTVRVDASAATYPVVVDPAWSTVASMAYVRNIPGYAVQSDGKVLVVGGGNSSGTTTFSEEFDPATNSWNSAQNLPSAKTANIAVSLGTSIVIPGLGSEGKNVAHWFTSSKTFLLSPPSSVNNHEGGPVVALNSTQVLTLGAGFGGTAAEIYQWSGGASWIAAGTIPRSRRGHVLALLPDGRAISIGGEVDTSGSIFPSFAPTKTTMVFTNSTKTWADGPSLNLQRSDPVVTKLASGALLVTGGIDDTTNKRVAVAEIYDPVSKTFKTTGAMATARNYHTATLLPTGKVLIAGGYGDTAGALTSAELYDPVAGTFSPAGSLSGRRAGHGAVALSGGRVLLFGGHNSSVPLSSAEIFQQADLAAACTAGYECASGNCVDAHCCESTSCAMDATCASGKCAKKGAVPCTMASECSSGFCVDGYCCDKACDGQCEACDVTGKQGVCSPTAGAPHGSRAACTGAIVGGECGSQCDGVDTTKCNFPTATKSCGSRGCLDGVENTVGVCDGEGRCSATPRTCAGYACQGDTCGTTCMSDEQCLSTHKCIEGKCASRGATCSPDNTSVVEGDGKITPCGLFTCKAGVCQSSCATSTDCTGGAICDGSGKCVQPPSTPTGDDGGCNVGRGSNGSWLVGLAAALILAGRSRKQRSRLPR